MRLINMNTLTIKEGATEEYEDQYAILSHNWIREQEETSLGKEVLYYDFLGLSKEYLVNS